VSYYFKKLCDEEIAMPQEFSSGVVIFRKEAGNVIYLLLHYEAGHWDFVKGNVERDESEEETARRETEEEAGIKDLGFVAGFSEKIEYFYKRENRTIHKQVVFLLAETKTKEVKISWEHIGFEWLPYGKALERLTYKNAKEVLEKAHAFLVKQ
jgi:8-oxo-dGTP pyrophosphatase MutT (NUDIX family)